MAPPVRFKKGDKVFGQGDSADVALLVIEGELRATVEADGVSREVGKVGKGEVFGEQALFVPHGHRTASVHATQPCLCLILTPKVVDHAYENVAIVALEKHLLGSQARRIRNTNLTIQRAWKGEKGGPSEGDGSQKKTSLMQRLSSIFGGR